MKANSGGAILANIMTIIIIVSNPLTQLIHGLDTAVPREILLPDLFVIIHNFMNI